MGVTFFILFLALASPVREVATTGVKNSKAPGPHQVFVSPTLGSDDNDGLSRNTPVSSLYRARAVARSLSATDRTDDTTTTTVRLMKGTHWLPRALILNETSDSSTIWTSDELGSGRQETTVRAGLRVSNWTKWKSLAQERVTIWRAPNPFMKSAGDHAPFYHLVEGSKPAIPARFPNPGAGWLYNWSKASGGFMWTTATGLPPRFETSFARAYVWHPYGYSELTGLQQVNFSAKTAQLSPTPHMMLVKMRLEGAIDFIDEAGEWALGEDGFVYFCPSTPIADLNAPDAPVISAVSAPRVFDIRGATTSPRDTVHHIAIENLTIVGSGWLKNFESEWTFRMNSQPGVDPSGRWANTREGMLRVENATAVSLRGCKVTAVGTSAVWVEHAASNVVVENNWIEDVGFIGVRIDGWDIGGGKNPIPGSFPFSKPSDADTSFGHVIRNNFIHNVGRHVTYGSAVYVHQSHSVLVENNVLSRSPRNLISVFGIAYMWTAGGARGPYSTANYPDQPPVAYGVNLSFFSQYEVTTSSNLTFRYNDISHACTDSQDCGAWEAWGPGKDNTITNNAFHDIWGGMAQATTIIFPDSANNNFTISKNVLYNNLASSDPVRSPGGGSGVIPTGLKGYNQTMQDNIIADSELNGGVFVGPSGGLTLGKISVRRNIFSNATGGHAIKCGGGTYTHSNAICVRDVDMVATSTVGARLDSVHGPKDKVNPAWFGFNSEQLAGPILATLDFNLYDAPLMPVNSTLRALRPDVDVHSLGVTDPHAIAFERTPYSKWWNRSHLDYAVPSTSAAVSKLGFRQPNLARIGLELDRWHFDAADMFARCPLRRVEAESADRVFGLMLEPSFGISFPVSRAPLGQMSGSAFALYRNVNFGNVGSQLKVFRMRVCTSAATDIPKASTVVLKAGSPHGPTIVSVDLSASKDISSSGCGYIPGSYWVPGVENDDPKAMGEVSSTLLTPLSGRVDLYLSLVGGYAAIDWFVFSAT